MLMAVIEARLLQSQGTPVRRRALFVSLLCQLAHMLLYTLLCQQFTIHELLTDIKHLFEIESQGVVMSDQARKTCGRALRATDRPIGEVAGILTIAAIRLVTAVSGESHRRLRGRPFRDFDTALISVTSSSAKRHKDAACVIDFYLREENKKTLDELCKVARQAHNLLDVATMQVNPNSFPSLLLHLKADDPRILSASSRKRSASALPSLARLVARKGRFTSLGLARSKLASSSGSTPPPSTATLKSSPSRTRSTSVASRTCTR